LYVPQIFGWAIDCFTGKQPGYQAIDAQYHDFEHTLQGALCMARLLHGRHRAKTEPVLPQKMFELGILALLLHDTGYLKKTGDTGGTGAKYTVVHVRRSADFAAELLTQKGLSPSDIASVQNMILCTGINAVLSKIPFQSDVEKVAGFALGTADLLGQMAADDYVDKLPVLYAEFVEAAGFDTLRSQSVGGFASAEDLKQKTPMFWEKYVRVTLDRDFAGLYRFLNDPATGRNYYLDRIEANISRIRHELARQTVSGSVA